MYQTRFKLANQEERSDAQIRLENQSDRDAVFKVNASGRL